MWLHGRRVSVGEARFTDSGWTWWRRVRRNPKGRLPCHWFVRRQGWVVGVTLLDQVRGWAEVIVYEDECGGVWRIPTADVQRVGERISIGGELHLFVPAAHFAYTPARGEHVTRAVGGCAMKRVADPAAATSARLTAAEREVIITASDAEHGVAHVFTESKSALARRLLRVAWAIGASVTRTGAGVEFDLPIRCLSVRVPRELTPAERVQRRRAAAVSQEARNGAESDGAPSVSAPPAMPLADAAVDNGAGATPVPTPTPLLSGTAG
jgi:hypothetical protein